jgi:hypothetical protein
VQHLQHSTLMGATPDRRCTHGSSLTDAGSSKIAMEHDDQKVHIASCMSTSSLVICHQLQTMLGCMPVWPAWGLDSTSDVSHSHRCTADQYDSTL